MDCSRARCGLRRFCGDPVAITGSGTTYNVAVSGMTASGTVIASLLAGVVLDAANNPSLASTSTDNTVTFSSLLLGDYNQNGTVDG